MENEKEEDIHEEIETNIKNTIEHIVISGGGLTLFTYYGVLKKSAENKIWDINNIKTIYGTSAGAILSVLLCLKYDWEISDNYIINRPWEKVFNINMYLLFDIFQRKGLFDLSVIKESLKPLFLGKDIDLNITFEDFFHVTNIELHLFVTDLNEFETIDVSYKTHPKWKVIDIVYSSASVPVIFAPCIFENKCLIDGGIFNNSPVQPCIDNGADAEKILSISYKENIHSKIEDEGTLLDYIIVLLNNLIKSINKEVFIETGIHYSTDFADISIEMILSLISNKEHRIELINKGCNTVMESL
jgi:NTE family protein|tara:strand:+ start:31 stop:933 length:903 start_codon:yes stop_codon:yes gene_type:complete